MRQTCRLGSDNVPLALFVKAGGALERQVVGFSRTGGEHDVLWVCSNEIGDILEIKMLH